MITFYRFLHSLFVLQEYLSGYTGHHSKTHLYNIKANSQDLKESSNITERSDMVSGPTHACCLDPGFGFQLKPSGAEGGNFKVQTP